MEEIRSISERIKTNQDDLEAWQRLGELVDDPQKRHECRDQVTRIHNERHGVSYPIPCKECSTLMRVAPAGAGRPVTTICPACCQSMELVVPGKPAGRIARPRSSRAKGPTGFAQLKRGLTLIAIIVSNLVPIFGILFLGWSVSSVMILYWTENVIAGLFTVLKMAFAQGGIEEGRSRRNSSSGTATTLGKLSLIPFFCVHFGAFCLGHGAFVVALFLPKDLTPRDWLNLLAGMWVPILGMLISYGIYFVQHYLRNGAYTYASLSGLMKEPYARIVPMHVGLIAAAFLIVTLGSPIWVVLFLVALKTGGDVFAYFRSMKKRRSRARVH